MNLRVAHRCSPFPGEVAAGDRPFFFERGQTSFFGLLDVLGHGPEAAEVASMATSLLQDIDFEHEDVGRCIQALHHGLRGTRGAAATLCRLSSGRIGVSGIGNVTARSSGSKLSLYGAPGILGRRLRRTRVGHMASSPGARIVLFTDGIRGDFSFGGLSESHGEDLCHRLMTHQRRVHDDASVLVADIVPGDEKT